MASDRNKTLFLSSTCYDLGAVRARIEEWARESGYRPLLSDRADFPVNPGQHRMDVCIAVARQADLMVLIVGGRFGAPFHRDPEISITWAEFRAASQARVPVLAFVDKRVWDERRLLRLDSATPLTATEDPRVFGFLSEIQRNECGYWMQIYSDEAEIIARLRAMTDLFPFAVHRSPSGLRRVGRCIETRSLSPEAQHHVRMVVGQVEHLKEEDLQWAMLAIPEVSVVRGPDEFHDNELHGFSVFVEPVTSVQGGAPEANVVRATGVGSAIREELFDAFNILL
jgi:hypothetical protein